MGKKKKNTVGRSVLHDGSLLLNAESPRIPWRLVVSVTSQSQMSSRSQTRCFRKAKWLNMRKNKGGTCHPNVSASLYEELCLPSPHAPNFYHQTLSHILPGPFTITFTLQEALPLSPILPDPFRCYAESY